MYSTLEVAPSSSYKKYSSIIQWVIIILIGCLILYRAIVLEITVDETYSYFLVKKWDIDTMSKTANTHWLTALFMRLLLWLPGHDLVWKLRLFPVLCWFLYSYSIIRLSSLFEKKWAACIFFAICIFNPYLIQFFSMARGYAPGCAFLAFSLWQITKISLADREKPEKWLPVFITAFIAVIANFSFLYFYISLTAIYFFHLLLNRKIHHLITWPGLLWIIWVGITTIVAAILLWQVKQQGELYYGGENLLNSLLQSLVVGLARNGRTSIHLSTTIIFIAVVIVFLLSFFDYWKTKKIHLHTIAIGTTISIILLNVVFHFFFNTPYLLARTALVIYIPIVLGVIGYVDTINIYSRIVNLFGVTAALVVVYVLSKNVYKSYDLKFFYEWPTALQQCLNFVQEKKATKVGMSITNKQMFDNYYQVAFPGKYQFNSEVVDEEIINKKPELVHQQGFEYLLLDVFAEETIHRSDLEAKRTFDFTITKVFKVK